MHGCCWLSVLKAKIRNIRVQFKGSGHGVSLWRIASSDFTQLHCAGSEAIVRRCHHFWYGCRFVGDFRRLLCDTYVSAYTF